MSEVGKAGRACGNYYPATREDAFSEARKEAQACSDKQQSCFVIEDAEHSPHVVFGYAVICRPKPEPKAEPKHPDRDAAEGASPTERRVPDWRQPKM